MAKDSPRLPKSGIYQICHAASGNVYIGSAIFISRRWNGHRHLLNTGTHHSPYLQRAWDKYGAAAFTFSVLEEVADTSSLFEREQYYLDTLHPAFNVLPQAGTARGNTRSLEAIEKQRAKMLGRKHAPETIKKMQAINGSAERKAQSSAQWKDKSKPAEQRAKMSAAMQGYRPICSRKRGVKMPEEFGKKISAIRSGKPSVINHTRETKEKMSLARQQWWARRNQQKQKGVVQPSLFAAD